MNDQCTYFLKKKKEKKNIKFYLSLLLKKKKFRFINHNYLKFYAFSPQSPNENNVSLIG